MKLIVVICVIAAATLAYSESILDTVQHIHYPTPPFKIPSPPSASDPEPQKIHRPSPPNKTQGPPSKFQSKPETVDVENLENYGPEFIAHIAKNLKPIGDYFNGKKVPTPKYQID